MKKRQCGATNENDMAFTGSCNQSGALITDIRTDDLLTDSSKTNYERMTAQLTI